MESKIVMKKPQPLKYYNSSGYNPYFQIGDFVYYVNDHDSPPYKIVAAERDPASKSRQRIIVDPIPFEYMDKFIPCEEDSCWMDSSWFSKQKARNPNN